MKTILTAATALFLLGNSSVFADPVDENAPFGSPNLDGEPSISIAAVTCSCETKYGTCSAVQTSCEGGLVEGCACFTRQSSTETELDTRLALLQRFTASVTSTVVAD